MWIEHPYVILSLCNSPCNRTTQQGAKSQGCLEQSTPRLSPTLQLAEILESQRSRWIVISYSVFRRTLTFENVIYMLHTNFIRFNVTYACHITSYTYISTNSLDAKQEQLAVLAKRNRGLLLLRLVRRRYRAVLSRLSLPQRCRGASRPPDLAPAPPHREGARGERSHHGAWVCVSAAELH